MLMLKLNVKTITSKVVIMLCVIIHVYAEIKHDTIIGMLVIQFKLSNETDIQYPSCYNIIQHTYISHK